ncbi:hypothetical protein, partial [Streptomyces lonarensis]
GLPLDWTAVLPEAGGPVELPTYAFQRRRYWPEFPERVRGAGGDAVAGLRYRVIWESLGSLSGGGLSGLWLV